MCDTWDLESLLHAPIECGCDFGVLLHRGRDPAVGVAFPQHRVDGAAEHLGVLGLDRLLRVVLRLLGVVRHGVALLLQLLDRRQQLRHRGADVGQLDDVGLRRLRNLAQFGQVVGLPLRRRQLLGEARQDTARQRDVPRVHGDAGGLGEGLHDRQQRVGGEGGGFVGLGVEDLCCGHAAPETSIIFAPCACRWLAAPRWLSRRVVAILLSWRC